MESHSDSGFEKRELKRRTLLQRITGQHPADNMSVEITNVLADKPIQSITLKELEAICEKYNTTLLREGLMSRTLYEQYLKYTLNDNMLTDTEIANLQHLKQILHLSDTQLSDIHKNFYNFYVRDALADGVLEDHEKDFLEKLKKELHVSDELAASLYSMNASAMLEKIIGEKISDNMLSPNEEEEIKAVAKSLHLDLEKDRMNRTRLEKYRLYWKIQNDKLPEVECSVPLLNLEKCHFRSYGNFYEYKQSPMSDGMLMSIKEKIASGIYWKTENLPLEIIQGQMNLIDSGKIFVTNSRLIFEGGKGTVIVPLDQITDFYTFKNGMRYTRMFSDADKPSFMEVFNNSDIFAIIFGKVLANRL
jgi:hypothetical protein